MKRIDGHLGIMFLLMVPSLSWGQAWLPDAGSTSVSIVHNDAETNEHYLPNGNEIDVGHTRVFSETLAVAYSPSDRWLISASVPYVRAGYHGTHPHPGTNIDDGSYRTTFTDLRVELHYQVLEQPCAFSPYVALVVPTHHYPSLGHAAPGRDLREQWLGFFLGKSLDKWLPRTYIQGRYSYVFAEQLAGVSHNRTNAEMELGYFIDPRWSVRVLASWQHTYGGINVPVPLSSRYYPYHDRLAAERYFQAGGGVSASVGTSSNAFLIYKRALSGANGHRLSNGFTLGFTHSFTRTG